MFQGCSGEDVALVDYQNKSFRLAADFLSFHAESLPNMFEVNAYVHRHYNGHAVLLLEMDLTPDSVYSSTERHAHSYFERFRPHRSRNSCRLIADDIKERECVYVSMELNAAWFVQQYSSEIVCSGIHARKRVLKLHFIRPRGTLPCCSPLVHYFQKGSRPPLALGGPGDLRSFPPFETYNVNFVWPHTNLGGL